MSLLSSLHSSAQALNVHSKSAEIAGHNLANLNTKGYARQRAVINSAGVHESQWGPQSQGITIHKISHIRNGLQDKQVIKEANARATLEVQHNVYTQLQSGLGEYIDRQSDAASLGSNSETNLSPGGISKSIDDLFNAFGEFSTPQSSSGTSTSQKVIDKALSLVDKVKVTEKRLSDLSTDIENQKVGSIDEANSILQRLADINAQISSFEAADPGVAIDLRDDRQRALEELAELINFEYSEVTGLNGQIEVKMKDTLAADVVLVRGGDKKGDFASTGSTITFNSSSTVALTGGTLHGYSEMKNTAIPTLISSLDTMVNKLVTDLNTDYSSSGNDFFDASGTTAATFALDSSLTSSSLVSSTASTGGSNEIALAMFERKNDFVNDMPDIASGLGRNLNNISNKLSNQSLVEENIKEQRESYSGVSINEEISNMLASQKAFQASAAVFAVIKEMINKITEL